MRKGKHPDFSGIFENSQRQFSFFENYEVEDEVEVNNALGVTEIDVDLVYPNPNQPRKIFDEEALNDLSASIKKHGIIQPIVVNKTDKGYMIIAGERRYRASIKAELKTIPVIIKNYTDRQVKEVSIIENLQREDLNPIEAANAMKKLMDDFSLTQEELAERLGKSRSSIANTLRLLTLNAEVIELVSQNKLSQGHARALITLPKPMQKILAYKSIKEGYSVREVEKKVREYLAPPKKKTPQKTNVSLELRDLISRMQRVFGTKVSAIGNDSKGRFYIDYYTKDDLDRLFEIVELLEKK
ncbi:MAG: ParB/RepB/Spo0J family partition protein [Clostridiales bacterium]|nr:ParB/RepB/Spo0J family partition protein [Clostridiales bacterium]